MAAPAFEDILSQIERLSPEDQLRLLEAHASTIRREGLGALHGARQTPLATTPQSSATFDPATDPLMLLAGSISSGDPSWAERHDEYLAES